MSLEWAASLLSGIDFLVKPNFVHFMLAAVTSLELKMARFGGSMETYPSHFDPLVPEDHDALKNEEIAALKVEVGDLKVALGTRSSIGKALGILIEREGITESAAFETLKAMSQNTNTKLRLVAARLVEEAQPRGEV